MRTSKHALDSEPGSRHQRCASKIIFRIGINVGDIIIDDDDIFGDGVNLAARVENECEPGDVCLSGKPDIAHTGGPAVQEALADAGRSGLASSVPRNKNSDAIGAGCGTESNGGPDVTNHGNS